jgi:hypothetical protein
MYSLMGWPEKILFCGGSQGEEKFAKKSGATS